MPFPEIKRLLKQSTGLEPALIGASAIERAIRERQRICQLPDAAAYRDLVRDSAAELQNLLESVVVVETSFFRDPEVFAALARFIREEWFRSQPARPLRMLSLPCSTGEEPYSMVMTALDAGLPAGRFRVDAIDISERSLAHARRGIYTEGAFRGWRIDERHRHFTRNGKDWRISDAVRHQVHFSCGNLLGALRLASAELYDIVFCRNLLIYFGPAAQQQAIDALGRLLAPAGTLFVGPAETVTFINRGFIPEGTPKAFAFRKAGTSANPAPGPPRVISRRATLEPASTTLAGAVPERGQDVPVAVDRVRPSVPGVARVACLEEGMRLADQGRLGEAAQSCQVAVERHGPSAEALHLLGLIRDAEGRAAEAMKCYRQAIYLNPHHEESLTHLALLLDAHDRKQEAHRLRLRARRAALRSAT